MNVQEGSPSIQRHMGLSALDDVTSDASTINVVLADEELADAVRRELRDDPITMTLDIDVEVWDRVAHLRGVVVGPEDVDAAEAVAIRVPGIGQVADDLDLGRPISRFHERQVGGT
jgi:osmotically-inducible protein OsmY